MNLEQILAALKAASDSLALLVDLENPTPEQVTEAKGLYEQIETLKAQKSEIESRIALKQANDKLQKELAEEAKKTAARPNNLPVGTISDTPQIKHNARYNSRHFKSNEDAIVSARFIKAALGSKNDMEWLAANAPQHIDNSMSTPHLKASTLTEGNDYYGGILVPTEMNNAIINLREEYGVFRKYADVQRLSGQTKLVPKAEGHSSVFAVGEGATMTQTDVTFRQIQLVLKKFGAYLKYSAELNDDAMVSLADAISQDLAVSFEQKVDACAFVGDGTSTYGGIVGLSQYNIWLDGVNGGSWTSNDTSKAYHGSVYTSSATTWASLVAADIDGVIYKARRYPGFKGTFFCHQQFYAQVIERLKTAVGGVTATELTNGWNGAWKGTPVVFVESMPSTTGADTVPLVYGDLKLGAMLGDGQGVAIDTQSTGTDWYADLIGVRAKSRWDVKVHDMGNYTSTAGSRLSGAVTCLAIKHS